MSKKVSIITPCLDGEKFLDRYFNSILNQSYTNLELIFINDGSTDKTDDIVKSFIPKFEQKNIDFIYINKENNEGQAKAVDEALKIFTGEYFIWPDSDDVLDSNSIKKRIDFLEKNQDYGMVRSNANVVSDKDLNKVLDKFEKNTDTDEYIFDDLVLEKKYMCCGCYMIRTSAFLKVNKNRNIYCGNSGQNWQIVLPVAYKYKCGYIDEPLYTYITRETSHSRNLKELEDLIKRSYEHEKTLIETLTRMDMDDSEFKKYMDIIEEKYLRQRFITGYNYDNKEIINKNYHALLDKYNVTQEEKIMYLLKKSKISNILTRAYLKITRLLGRENDSNN